MKQRDRVFLRQWGVHYCEDPTTGKQETLNRCTRWGFKPWIMADTSTTTRPA